MGDSLVVTTNHCSNFRFATRRAKGEAVGKPLLKLLLYMFMVLQFFS